MKANRRSLVSTFSLAAVLACASGLAAAADDSSSKPVRFENSCAAEVQAELDHAVTLLHSFEYPETKVLFAEIIEKEPTCAVAYWGAAMSLWHPLWAPPGRADLEAGAALVATARELPMTAREAAYVEAIGAFFSSTDTSTHRQRAGAFEDQMARLYAGHLDDPEAAVFYALAVLATADPHDKSYAHQFKSAALLNWVLTSRPRHPGALHYLIHSYDFPGLAHLALDAAMTYAEAAPDSAHAQHMPSHIFTRLGLWERSLSSNHDSTRSAAEYTERAQLPGHYDEGLHSMDYLMYAMLQTARDAEAAELLTRLGEIDKTHPENFKVAYTFAASPARYALERREWEEASRLELAHSDFAWEDYGWARSIHHFARGLGAARSGRLDLAGRELETIEALERELPATTLPYWREEVEVHAAAVRSWILLAEGRVPEALEMASAAADREDAVDKHPVTPGEVLPARELYADMLLEAGNHQEALEQYEIVLEGSPNRLNALLGAAAAAEGCGEAELVERYDAMAREQTRFGNRERSGLARVWQTEP